MFKMLWCSLWSMLIMQYTFSIFNLQSNVCQLCYVLIDHCTNCQSVNNNVVCVQCSSIACSQCLIEQFYDNSNRVCQSCPLNCLNCISSLVCITCSNGYYLNNITKQCTSSCPANMKAYLTIFSAFLNLKLRIMLPWSYKYFSLHITVYILPTKLLFI